MNRPDRRIRRRGPLALTGAITILSAISCSDTPSDVDEEPVLTMSKGAGDNQSALVGTAVPVLPSVRVTDSDGQGVPGVRITFSVTTGGGTVTSGAPTTDASGTAQAGVWTLGQEGPNTLLASASDSHVVGSPVTFTATATPWPPVLIEAIAGDGQIVGVDEPVPIAPSIRLTDANGSPVSGHEVEFAVVAGGGSVAGASQTTDASGVATVGTWIPSAHLGTDHRLTATAAGSGITGNPVTFSATTARQVSVVGGTLNRAAGSPGTAFLVNLEVNPNVDLTVEGPPGWNGGAPLVFGAFEPNNIDRSRGVALFPGIEAAPGTYGVTAPGLLRGEFTVDVGRTVPPPSNVSVAYSPSATAGSFAYVVNWTAGPEHRSFLIVLRELGSGDVIAHGVVPCCSAGADPLPLVPGVAYQTDVFAFGTNLLPTAAPLPSQFDAGWMGVIKGVRSSATPATVAVAAEGVDLHELLRRSSGGGGTSIQPRR